MSRLTGNGLQGPRVRLRGARPTSDACSPRAGGAPDDVRRGPTASRLTGNGPGKRPASGITAHGRYEPFQPGYIITLKSGHRSARLEESTAARAREIANAIYAEHPHLTERDALAVRSLARTEAIVEYLVDYVAEHALIGANDEPGKLSTHLRQ